jgi:hypothetical protein
MTAPKPQPVQFTVLCCRARRALLPASGILVCLACDAGLDMPHAAERTDVPAGVTRWPLPS